jgi:uncharacterized protein (TIGR03435 family)
VGPIQAKRIGIALNAPQLGVDATQQQAYAADDQAGRKISMEQFLVVLSRPASLTYVDRPIVDRTGLTGSTDFTLDFAPQSAMETGAISRSALPSIFTALEEQLGMKLKTETGPVDVIVIDRVEEPSEN